MDTENQDMATMPIRDLITGLRQKAKKLGDSGNIVDCLVLNVLTNRLKDQADIIDNLTEEIFECENNPNFGGHSFCTREEQKAVNP
jgi:hypothetical protein